MAKVSKIVATNNGPTEAENEGYERSVGYKVLIVSNTTETARHRVRHSRWSFWEFPVDDELWYLGRPQTRILAVSLRSDNAKDRWHSVSTSR
jgi:hypothetical protein